MKKLAVQQDFLPLATWYTGGDARATLVYPPTPDRATAKAEWSKDVQYIRRCGFNTVRAWIDWASGEPEPGHYNFETLELLFEMAREAGLKVLVQVYLDSAPDWLPVIYPDSAYVSSGGVAIHSQTSPGYCYDHPGVRAAAERFLIELASFVQRQPNFYAWDLWSEPHIVQWAYFDYLPARSSFCYCHYTKQRFRNWLKSKYDSLAELNRSWYRTFTSWDTVEPPRFISLMAYTDFIDWQEFIVDKIAQDLAWRSQVVKQVNPNFITTSHSAIPGIFTIPYTNEGEPDDWRMARSVDIWGTSYYPKHVGAKETSDPAMSAAYLDSTRSSTWAAGKPFWLGELQGGHGYVGTFAMPVTARDERIWTWGPLAHGAKGLCWYAWKPMMRGYESAGFGLANLDGTPSERALAAGGIARLVTERMDLFLPAQPVQAQAAVVYDIWANMVWAGLRENSSYVPSRSLVGAYRSLFENHHPADFLHVDLLGQGHTEGYRLLYLPFGIALPKAAAAQLRRFVENGGVVVAEARTAWNDVTGRCGEAVPGFGLRDLFGAEEEGTYRVDPAAGTVLKVVPHELPAAALPSGEPDAGSVSGSDLTGRGLRLPLEVGTAVRGALFEQHLRLLLGSDAQVLATFADGAPAVTARRVGRGVAVLVGTMLSYAYQTQRDPGAGRLLAAFQEWAGLVRPVEVDHVNSSEQPWVEPRLMESTGGRWIFFAFNHGNTTITPRFRLLLSDRPEGQTPPAARASYLARELVWQEGLAGGEQQLAPGTHWQAPQRLVAGEDGRYELSKVLVPGEVWVVELVPQG
ncbi:MAG: beta-galactosidase [Limnochordaceae bacterium]|nr:beta-galactosidase [Limnochordaceae bacterium]